MVTALILLVLSVLGWKWDRVKAKTKRTFNVIWGQTVGRILGYMK